MKKNVKEQRMKELEEQFSEWEGWEVYQGVKQTNM